MKKVLLVTASLIALGAAAPAVAADLAARPYTKAPPMIAAVYDWTGFYIGANGGWGSSRNSWDLVAPFWLAPRVRMTRPAARSVARSAIAGRLARWVFGLEAQGNWADFSGSNVSLLVRRLRQPHERRCVRPVHRPGRLCRQQRPALRQGRCCRDLEQLSHQHVSAARSLASPATTPAGAARSAPASNTPSPRTGRLASSTITCSCRTVPTTSPRRPARPSAPTASSQDVDLVTARLNYRFGGPVIAQVLIFRDSCENRSPGPCPGLFSWAERPINHRDLPA